MPSISVEKSQAAKAPVLSQPEPGLMAAGQLSQGSITSNPDLAPRTGSRHEEVAKAWQDMFDDGKDYGPVDETTQGQKNSLALSTQSDNDVSTASSEIHFPRTFDPKDADLSLYSILPGGITLTSDLQTISTHEKRKSGNELKGVCISCCGPDAYSATKKKFAHASLRVEDYYLDLIKQMEFLETEFHLETPTSFFSEELNLLGAQIWFVTLALGRQMNEKTLEEENTKKFRTLYQTLVNTALCLLKRNISLESTLKTFSDIGATCIKSMKKSHTGSSETDLAAERIGDEAYVPRDQSAIMELVVRAMLYRKTWENTFYSEVKRTTPSTEYMAYGPDTLKDRKELDIFMRNVSKAGWVNFQTHFLHTSRVELLEEILRQTVQGLKIVRQYLPKVVKKLKYGCSDWTCHQTCTPWVKKMVSYVEIIGASDTYNQEEGEVVRLQIFAAEIFLKNIVTRGNIIRKEVRNVVETILTSCEYLENLYFFRLPKGDNLVKLKKMYSQETEVKAPENETFDDGKFFLSDYVRVLKQVPIRYGMTEYILLNRINTSRKHSGADFDGPRFLKVG